MDAPPVLPDEPPPELPDEPPPPLPSSEAPPTEKPAVGLSVKKPIRSSLSGSRLSDKSIGGGGAADKYRFSAAARGGGKLVSGSSVDKDSGSSQPRLSASKRLSAASVKTDSSPSPSAADPAKPVGILKTGGLRKLSAPAGLGKVNSNPIPSNTSPQTSPLTLRKPTSSLATSPSLARSSRMQSTARRSIVRPPSEEVKPKSDEPLTPETKAGDAKPQPSAENEPDPAAASYNPSLTNVRDSITRQRAGSIKGGSGPLTATARLRAARRANQMKRQSSEDSATERASGTTSPISPDEGKPKKDRPGSAGRLLDESRTRSGSMGSAALEDARQRIRGRISRSPSTELLDAPDSTPTSDTPAVAAARSVSPSIVATSKSAVLMSVASKTASSSPRITVSPAKDDKASRQPLGLRKSALSTSQSQLKDATLSAIASASLDDDTRTQAPTAGTSRASRVPNVEKPPPLDDSPKKHLNLKDHRQRIADARAASKRESTVSNGSLGIVSPLSSISRISDFSVSALMKDLDSSDNDSDSDAPAVPPDTPPPIPDEAPPPIPDMEPSTPASESPPLPTASPSLPDEPPPVPVTTEPTVINSAPEPIHTSSKPATPTIVSRSPKTSLFASTRSSPGPTAKPGLSSAMLAAKRKNSGSLFTSPSISDNKPSTAQDNHNKPATGSSPVALVATRTSDSSISSDSKQPSKYSFMSRFGAASQERPTEPDAPPPPVPSSMTPDTTNTKAAENTSNKGAEAPSDSSIRKTTVVKKKRYVVSKREGCKASHEGDTALRSADSYESLDWDRKSSRSMSVSSKISDAISIGTDYSIDSPVVSPKCPPDATSTAKESLTEGSMPGQAAGMSSEASAGQQPSRADATRRSYTRAERDEAREKFVASHRKDSVTSKTSVPPSSTTGDSTATAPTAEVPSNRSLTRPLSSAVGLGGTDMLESLLGDLDADTKRLLSGEQQPEPEPKATTQVMALAKANLSSGDSKSSGSPSGGVGESGSLRKGKRVSLTPTHSMVVSSRAEIVAVHSMTPEVSPKIVKQHTVPERDMPQLPTSPPPTELAPAVPLPSAPSPVDKRRRFGKQHAATIDSGAVAHLTDMQRFSTPSKAVIDEDGDDRMPSPQPKSRDPEGMEARQSVRRQTLGAWTSEGSSSAARRTSGIDSWTNDDVGDWLVDQGFQDLVELFQDQKVTGKNLVGITANQLETMGVESRHRQQELIANRNTLLETEEMMNEFSSNMHLTGSQDALRSGEDAISSKLNTGPSSSLSGTSSVVEHRAPKRSITSSGAKWQTQDDEISAQLAQLRERQKLTDRLLGSREDLFGGIQRSDSVSSLPKQPSLPRESEQQGVPVISVQSPLFSPQGSDSAFEYGNEEADVRRRSRMSAASQLERRTSIRMKPIMTWGYNELAIYLCDHGISLSVTDKLRALEIDGMQMSNMTSDDLAELDIKGTQAEKLLAEVDKLRYLRRMSQQSAASATQEDEDLDADDAFERVVPAITVRSDNSMSHGDGNVVDGHSSIPSTTSFAGPRLSNIPEASLLRGQSLSPPPDDDGDISTQPSESESDAEDVTSRLPKLRQEPISQTSFSSVEPPDLFRTLSRSHKKAHGGSHVSSPVQKFDLGYDIQESVPSKHMNDWNHREVTLWLEECNFLRYKQKASEILLEGKDLAVVDLHLLDRLGVETDEEREAFLAAVYRASSSTNATDSVKALLRLSEGENKEKLSAMLEVLESSSPSTTTAELSTYMDGNLMDLLWPLQEKQSSAQKHDSTGSQDGGTLSSSGRPLALEIQDAKHRHSAKQKHDKKGKKPQRVSFTDDDVPNRLSQNKDFDGQRSKSMGKGPFKSKLARWFGEGDHHYAIQASVRTRSRGDELIEGNVKVYLRNLQPDTEYKAFHINSTTSAFQLIQLVLERMDIYEDPQRYRLVETSLRPGVPDRDVAAFECPLLLQSLWHNDNEFHFGLRGQPVGTIKVHFGIRGAKKSDITMQISPYTSTHQVIVLVLRKSGMDVSGAESYCLTEDIPNKGESILGDGAYPLLHSVACGHKHNLWLRARPAVISRPRSRPSSPRKHDASGHSNVNMQEAYNRLQTHIVRQRLESERDRAMLEAELRNLQEQSSLASSPLKSPPPALDEQSVEKIQKITSQLQIYATRLKQTTVHAEQRASTESKSAKEVLVLNERVANLEAQQKEKTTQLYKLLEEKEMLNEQLSTKENTIAYLRRENQVLSVDNKAARDTGVNPVNRELEDQLEELQAQKNVKEQEIAGLKEEISQSRRLSIRDRRKSDTPQPKVEARPIFLAQLVEEATENQHLRLIAVEINCRPSKDPGWILSPTSAEETTQVTIMALQTGGPAHKTGQLLVGDSIVEINNQPITKEEDIASALRIKRTASVVVARIAKNPTPQALASTPVPAPKQPTVDVEAAVVEACKSLRTEHADEVESLHLLMQTLETQVREREKECQTLQSRMETMQHELEEAEMSNETVARLEMQAHDLRQQLDASEKAREQLRSSLTNLTPHSSMQNIHTASLDQDLSGLRKKLVLSEEERSVLRSAVAEKEARISTLSDELTAKETQLAALKRERDGALRSFRDSVDISDKEDSTRMSSDRLTSASQNDLIAALQEKEEEASRGKVYVDKLLTLVIDEAPQLLGKISKLSEERSQPKAQQDEWF